MIEMGVDGCLYLPFYKHPKCLARRRQSVPGLFLGCRRRSSGTIASCRPPRDHEIADGDLHRLAVLILRRRPHLDQSLLRTGLRGPHFENFALDVELIPGPHGPRPAELVEARADDSASGLQLALHQEPHGHCRGVPAARRQASEYRTARGLFVEMEGLRVEFGGESLDPRFFDTQTPGAEGLPYREVLEISSGHCCGLPG